MTISFVEKITESNTEEHNFLLRYYARVGVSLKLEILLKHRKLLYSLKNNYSDAKIEEISYAALILSIKYQYADRKKLLDKKFEDMSLEEIRKITLINIRSFKEKKHYKKTKKNGLLRYLGLIRMMREEDIGFRDIADYIRTEYKFKVGYSTVYDMWKEIEEN